MAVPGLDAFDVRRPAHPGTDFDIAVVVDSARARWVVRAPVHPAAGAALEAEVGEGVHAVLDGADLAVSLRRSRVPHMTRLREGLPPGMPVINLPFLFARSHGVRATAKIAESLGEELGF